MNDAGENAPMLIEAFFDAGQSLKHQNPQFAVPDANMINHVLSSHNAGYEVSPPNPVARNPHAPVPIEKLPPSLDAQAHEIIHRSLKQSDEYLTAGKNRQAVQEILWLLETVSTAFQGIPIGEGTIQGKYFNKIADELKQHRKGQLAEQAINWITGGGVRHGATLSSDAELAPHEARLFCNLIRSYMHFLLEEYDSLKR